MFKEYLQLIRLPGIFTAFSNVLIGYFFAISLNPQFDELPLLLITSGLFFSAGMIFNDYFDFKADQKNRPHRPLPSGKISKRTALYSGIIFLIIGNIVSFHIGTQTLLISLCMTGLILLYNYKTKFYPFIGIFNLSIIRFLNVILGFSIISLSLEIIYYGIPIAIFIGGISFLAKYEMRASIVLHRRFNMILNVITITFVGILIINDFQIEFMIFFCIFSFFSLYSFFQKDFSMSNIQKLVNIQILSIIFLDATLIVLLSSFYYGILISLFFIPAYFIGKKIYLT